MTEGTKLRPFRRMTGPLVALPTLTLLCACAAAVEQAEIRLAEDERTSYSAVVSSGRFDKKLMTKTADDFTKCGLRVRPFATAENPHGLAVNLPDIQSQDVATYMRCLPGGARVEVETNKHLGWLYTYYDLDVRIALPRCTLRRHSSDPARVLALRTPSPAILPRRLKLRLPGSISGSELESDVEGMRFKAEDKANVTTVTAILPDGYANGGWPSGKAHCEKFIPRYRGESEQKFETDSFHVAVHSKQALFNLTTLFSVAGLLISSGIIAAIVRRLIGQPKAPPAGGQGSASASARRPRRRKDDDG